MTLREGIELMQPYNYGVGFTLVLSTDESEEVIDIASEMEECNRISLLVDYFDVYIAFDRDAERPNADNNNKPKSFLLLKGSGYFETNIKLISKITAINVNDGEKPRLRGIAWGR